MEKRHIHLSKAKNTKNDEFYTLYEDIEKEIKHYDKDNFKDKIIYCNCDDYRFSNFVKFFKDNFKELGLKGLISTNFNIGDGSFYYAYNGEKEVIKEIENGSFDSEFCLALLEKSDLVITNPPFSLFRKYIDLLINKDKKFLVIGNLNFISNKNMFKYVMQNKIRLGYRNTIMNFIISAANNKFINARFFTNLEVNNKLKKVADKDFKNYVYQKYHNCDAIDIPKSSMIPYNYNGVMGVPISYIDYFDYDMFEIVGLGNFGLFDSTFNYSNCYEFKNNTKTRSANYIKKLLLIKTNVKPVKTCYISDNVDGYLLLPYARLLVKRKNFT